MEPRWPCVGQRDVHQLDSGLCITDHGTALSRFRVAALGHPVRNLNWGVFSGRAEHYKDATTIRSDAQRLNRAVASGVNRLWISQRVKRIPARLGEAVIGNMFADHLKKIALLLREPSALWSLWRAGVGRLGARFEISKLRREPRSELDRESIVVAHEVDALTVATQQRVRLAGSRVRKLPRGSVVIIDHVDVACVFRGSKPFAARGGRARERWASRVTLGERQLLWFRTGERTHTIGCRYGAPACSRLHPAEVNPTTIERPVDIGGRSAVQLGPPHDVFDGEIERRSRRCRVH